MRNTQAWGWLAAGVVALGLNGFYQDGGAEWAHRAAERIADRADYAIERVTGQAERLVAEARMTADREDMGREGMDREGMGREDTGRESIERAAAMRRAAVSCRLSTALARVQTRAARTRVADFDAMSAQERAQMDRWQAAQERAQARAQAQIDRQTARVRVLRLSSEEVNPLEIRMACSGVQVHVPEVNIPAIHISAIHVPEVRIPEMNVPQIHIPQVTIPRIPAVSIAAPVISSDESGSDPI